MYHDLNMKYGVSMMYPGCLVVCLKLMLNLNHYYLRWYYRVFTLFMFMISVFKRLHLHSLLSSFVGYGTILLHP